MLRYLVNLSIVAFHIGPSQPFTEGSVQKIYLVLLKHRSESKQHRPFLEDDRYGINCFGINDLLAQIRCHQY